jgi:hypothetical protein
MMGLTNTPLDGYSQVQRATVAFNTFVNCRASLRIGLADTYSSNQVTTLPPQDCVIANNVISSTLASLVEMDATPLNLAWEGNIMFGSALGISQPAGITVADPKLDLASDGLWRPASNSPVRGAAVGSFPFVTNDIDGQPRAGLLDAGCDQLSAAPVMSMPLTAADVGPVWINPPRLTFGKIGTASQPPAIQWSASLGAPYQVQSSSNMLDWINVQPPLIATNDPQTWTDPTLGGKTPAKGVRFYRVALVP